MCEICLQTPCAVGCPNAPEPTPIKVCELCQEAIHAHERFYMIDDNVPVCVCCIAQASVAISDHMEPITCTVCGESVDEGDPEDYTCIEGKAYCNSCMDDFEQSAGWEDN